MVEMARTCAPDIEPDLIVTVMGNNEYLDLVSFGRSAPEMHRAILARRLEQHSALARFLRFTPRLDPAHPPPSWPSFPRTPEIMDYVTGRLKRSIHHLAEFARAHHAKLLVCTVPVNYRYQSLREWFFTDNLGPPYPPEFVKARWGMYYEDYETAAAEMEKRLAKLPDDPAAHLIAALAYRKLGRQPAAEEHFARTIALLAKRDQRPGPILFENTAMRLIAACELYGKEACAGEIEPLLPGMAQTALNDARAASMFHHQRGFLLSLLGRDAEAREEFRAAINSLLLPANRADDWINRTLVEAAREEGDVEVFDLAAALADISPAKIPGYDYFFDYCHYTALGHTAVGALLARQIAALAGVAIRAPSALDAVTEERALRRKRPTDLPDIDHWVGADYRPECLVSELVCWPEFEYPQNDLARHLTGGQAALTRVFMGNWYAASPSRDNTGERARQYYEQALALDPRLAAARANLGWLNLYR
jgi:tetratricopeptide (TPR) repeat protein